jgi:hypothetical protein
MDDYSKGWTVYRGSGKALGEQISKKKHLRI